MNASASSSRSLSTNAPGQLWCVRAAPLTQEISRYCCPGRVVSVLEGGYGKYEKVKQEGKGDDAPLEFVLNVSLARCCCVCGLAGVCRCTPMLVGGVRSTICNFVFGVSLLGFLSCVVPTRRLPCVCVCVFALCRASARTWQITALDT